MSICASQNVVFHLFPDDFLQDFGQYLAICFVSALRQQSQARKNKAEGPVTQLYVFQFQSALLR